MAEQLTLKQKNTKKPRNLRGFCVLHFSIGYHKMLLAGEVGCSPQPTHHGGRGNRPCAAASVGRRHRNSSRREILVGAGTPGVLSVLLRSSGHGRRYGRSAMAGSSVGASHCPAVSLPSSSTNCRPSACSNMSRPVPATTDDWQIGHHLFCFCCRHSHGGMGLAC